MYYTRTIDSVSITLWQLASFCCDGWRVFVVAVGVRKQVPKIPAGGLRLQMLASTEPEKFIQIENTFAVNLRRSGIRRHRPRPDIDDALSVLEGAELQCALQAFLHRKVRQRLRLLLQFAGRTTILRAKGTAAESGYGITDRAVTHIVFIYATILSKLYLEFSAANGKMSAFFPLAM